MAQLCPLMIWLRDFAWLQEGKSHVQLKKRNLCTSGQDNYEHIYLKKVCSILISPRWNICSSKLCFKYTFPSHIHLNNSPLFIPFYYFSLQKYSSWGVFVRQSRNDGCSPALCVRTQTEYILVFLYEGWLIILHQVRTKQNVFHDLLLCPATFSSGKMNGRGSWRSKPLWLVLRHEVPRSLAADWSKRLSVSAHSSYAFRTNTALAGFLGVIRAFCSGPGRSFVSSRTLWHRGEDKTCCWTAAVSLGRRVTSHGASMHVIKRGELSLLLLPISGLS